MSDTNLAEIRASVVERIRAALDQSGLSVAELARASGVSKATIHRALEEDGKFVPSMATLGKIEAAVGESPPAPSTVLGERIQKRLLELGRAARNVSVEAGLSPDALRMIISGRSQSPRGETLSALAGALGCDVRFLLGETDEPGSAEPTIVESPHSEAVRQALAEPPPIHMTVSADGFAHLRMDMKLPLDVAVEILALVQGKTDE